MRLLDKFRGCLIGGACGDALGYAVEFVKYDAILRKYGPKGITAYDLNGPSGKALISDDTQMTLFTAAALLDERAVKALSGDDEKSWIGCVWDYYQAWLSTQSRGVKPEHLNCWLNEIAELHSCRAPGNTCLSALCGSQAGTMAHPINDSKGCGGVMRVAPIGLWGAGAYASADSVTKQRVVDIADKAGAAAAAVTHGHELGYMAAAGLVHMVCLACSEPSVPLRAIVQSMRQALARRFAGRRHLPDMLNIIDRAVDLSGSAVLSDEQAICRLGAGWVAEETLAIAIYCSLKYSHDFPRAIVAAVNHSGDSDSTGAVTGNILGAYLGINAIPQEFVADLECREVILRMADELYAGIVGDDPRDDEEEQLA